MNKRVALLVLVVAVVAVVAVGWTISKRSSSDGWTTVPGGSYTRFQDISCASPKFCGLVGPSNRVGELVDGTVHHSSISGLHGRTVNFTAIACPSANLCFASDLSGSLVKYWHHSWRYVGRLATQSSEYLTSISCSTESFCMVGSSSGAVYVYDHGTWANTAPPLSGSGSAPIGRTWSPGA